MLTHIRDKTRPARYVVRDAALDVAGVAASVGGAALSTGGHLVAGAGFTVADSVTLGKVESIGERKHEHFEEMQDGRRDITAAVRAMCSHTPFYCGEPDCGMADWMSTLPDDCNVTQLFLPGTHDTCSTQGGALGQCQSWSLEQQLHAGIRVFDIRAKHVSDSLPIYHGIVNLQCDFNEVVEVLEKFVMQHPSEALFVRVRREGESGEHARTFDEEVASRLRQPTLWDRNCRGWTSLGTMRGHITCLAYGSHLRLFRQKMEVQDEYKLGNESEKFAAIVELATKQRETDTLAVNFCSAVGLDGNVCFKAPRDVAYQVNEKVMQAMGTFRPGIYMFDFPGNGLIKSTVARNFQQG